MVTAIGAAVLDALGIDYARLQEQIDSFGLAAQGFKARLESCDWRSDPLLLRQLNDQRTKLDRVFLLPEGLPSIPVFKHAIVSPNSNGGLFGFLAFPGLLDLATEVGRLEAGSEAQVAKAKELDKHVSDLMIVVKAAADYLKEPEMFT